MTAVADDPFARLGLPPRFDLDPAELDRAFLAASRAAHPDHHAGGQDATAAVNAAYHTLRDPVRRAEFLLGGTAGGQDPALLMEVMDIREQADAGDRAGAVGRVTTAITATLGDLTEAFRRGDVEQARRHTTALKTLRSLHRDLDD